MTHVSVICAYAVKSEVAVINDTTKRHDAMWDYRRGPPRPIDNPSMRNALADLLAKPATPAPTFLNSLLDAPLPPAPPPLRVRNLVGTSGNSCRCRSWLDHWANHAGWRPTYCSVHGCMESATVGGHVQKVGLFDRDWYIVPLCYGCNNWHGDLLISSLTGLVPANVSATCGR